MAGLDLFGVWEDPPVLWQGFEFSRVTVVVPAGMAECGCSWLSRADGEFQLVLIACGLPTLKMGFDVVSNPSDALPTVFSKLPSHMCCYSWSSDDQAN